MATEIAAGQTLEATFTVSASIDGDAWPAQWFGQPHRVRLSVADRTGQPLPPAMVTSGEFILTGA